jgi:hypothetical protein
MRGRGGRGVADAKLTHSSVGAMEENNVRHGECEAPIPSPTHPELPAQRLIKYCNHSVPLSPFPPNGQRAGPACWDGIPLAYSARPINRIAVALTSDQANPLTSTAPGPVLRQTQVVAILRMPLPVPTPDRGLRLGYVM